MPAILAYPVAIGAWEIGTALFVSAAALWATSEPGQKAISDGVGAVGDLATDAANTTSDAIGTAVDSIADAITSQSASQSEIDAKTQTAAPAIPASQSQSRTQNCDCGKYIEKMDRLINGAKINSDPNSGRTKGIKQRICEQKHGAIEPGAPGWQAHEDNISQQWSGVENTLVKAIRCGCVIPPLLLKDIAVYTYKVWAPRERISYMPGHSQYCYAMAKLGIEG